MTRHVATVTVNEFGATVEYLDARGLERLDRLAVLTIPEQVRVTCTAYREVRSRQRVGEEG